MAEPYDGGIDGERCLRPTTPFLETRQLAAQYLCDLGIPNNAGIGNVLVYTRTIDDLSRKQGRRLSLLTSPINPPIGLAPGEDGFAIWRNNPHINNIVNADEIDPNIMAVINSERDNIAHFGHMIENIAYYYGVRPRILRPSLYLTEAECTWAIETLQRFSRPIICLHPYSTSASRPGHPWYLDNWNKLIGRLKNIASVFEVHLRDVENKSLNLWSIPTTLRQMFALVWASDLVIGFDSAVTHVATAFERQAIVLWDPSQKVEIEEKWQHGFALAALSRWSYPQNANIMLLGGHQDDLVTLIADRARERLMASYG